MLLQDIRYAIRSFGKNPGFASVVVVTLALGIGANTAIFTLVDAVLLRPLPVHEPGELADVWTSCRRGFLYCSSSYPDFLDYRDRNRSFTNLAAFGGTELTLNDANRARLTGTMLVTGNYFSLFEWFRDVENELRPMVVKSFEMEKGKGSERIAMSLQIVAYRAEDET